MHPCLSGHPPSSDSGNMRLAPPNALGLWLGQQAIELPVAGERAFPTAPGPSLALPAARSAAADTHAGRDQAAGTVPRGLQAAQEYPAISIQPLAGASVSLGLHAPSDLALSPLLHAQPLHHHQYQQCGQPPASIPQTAAPASAPLAAGSGTCKTHGAAGIEAPGADAAGVFDAIWPPGQSPEDFLLGGLARCMAARCAPSPSDGLLRVPLAAAGASGGPPFFWRHAALQAPGAGVTRRS
jgi:hypothetical protein